MGRSYQQKTVSQKLDRMRNAAEPHASTSAARLMPAMALRPMNGRRVITLIMAKSGARSWARSTVMGDEQSCHRRHRRGARVESRR